MKLSETVRTLMRDGKGILDISEDNGTLDELFLLHGISPNEETRRVYRELLLKTEGIERFLSACILSEDAMRSSLSDGTPLYDVIASKDMLVGVSFSDMARADAEFKKQLDEYRSLALAFSKLHIITRIEDTRTNSDVAQHIRDAVRYAQILQEKNIVPLIALEVVSDGAHTAGQAEDHLIELLSLASDGIESGGLDAKGLVLGASMAVTGSANPSRATANEVAGRTLRALTSSVAVLGGVVFLSGAESPEESARNLNAIARLEPHPWPITFSFGSAFHTPVLAAWKGQENNTAEAQSVFLRRLSLSEAADAGGYAPQIEKI